MNKKREIKEKILVWRCSKCKSVQISKGSEHHKLDYCSCKTCFVDLENYCCRFSYPSGVKIEKLYDEKNIPFEILREIQTWGILKGNYIQKVGDISVPVPHYEYKPICDLELDHIFNILDTQKQISSYLRRILMQEIEFRYRNPYFKGRFLEDLK